MVISNIKRFSFRLGPRPICKHCSVRPASTYRNARGLCDTCDRDQSIRWLYPLPESVQKYARVGNAGVRNGKDVKRGKKPKVPTDAEPGSWKKIAVMEQRAANCEELHHPLDVQCDPRRKIEPYVIPEVKDRRPSR